MKVSSKENHGKCFKFIGADSNQKQTTHLISNNTSLLAPSNEEGFDTCSFCSGYSHEGSIFAYGESTESCGNIASNTSSGSSLSVTVSGSCFTTASSGGSCSGGGCSYSC